MSRLRELMEELCPNGVEYKKLGEIAHYAKTRINICNIEIHNYVGVEHLRQNKEGRIQSLSLPDSDSVIEFCTDDILIGNIRPYLKKIWLADCNGGTNGDVLTIRLNKGRGILPRYLFYVLSSECFFAYDMKYAKGAKMPRGDKKAVMNYEIPVPPLEIQNEIVKLLDNFTELTAELTEQLMTELTLRKKQYNFYRDSLLNFVRVDDTIVQTDRQTDRQAQRISKFGLLRKTFDVEWKTLGEVCGLKAGIAISASCIREQKNDVYKTPCYGGNGLRGYVQEVNHYSDAPLIGRQGALCGNVCFAKAPYYATEHAVIVDGKKNFNNRFLFHVLVNMNLGQYKTAGAQPGLSVKRLNKVKIAIPKLEIQNSIANILDRFDALCNDLTRGLPAEIAARKKQYEHYRDKLLTFPRSKLEERS